MTSQTGTAVIHAPSVAEWDYTVTAIHARHNETLETALKERGRQGWELVFIHMPVPFEYLCILKRPIA
jgi:hypothetical protein